MRTVEEWRQVLRDALKQAMKQRQAHSVAALRETIAAIDNAEAASLDQAPAAQEGVIAGGVAGLGAGEVPRKALSPEEVAKLIEREIAERRSEAATWAGLGRHDDAERLATQADLIASLSERT
jgi:uncharacterized protein YqeY